jgi:hypothetical protein
VVALLSLHFGVHLSDTIYLGQNFKSSWNSCSSVVTITSAPRFDAANLLFGVNLGAAENCLLVHFSYLFNLGPFC